MKKVIALLVAVLMLLPSAFAVSVGGGITPDIITEDFPPLVWLCDHRVVLDDEVEPGRLCNPPVGDADDEDTDEDGEGYKKCKRTQDVSSYELDGTYLWERINNYAFEGEQIVWDVLVMDKNGIEKIEDVFATIGDSQGEGNDIEANCILDEIVDCTEDGKDRWGEPCIPRSCNGRIDEEYLWKIPDNMAAFYKCIFTVETPESMYGEYWITVEATDLDGLSGTMDENEYWFLNPVIQLSIDGDLTFEDVRPGTDAYSSTLLVGNDADAGSGVMLDMFITGTDFYDSSSSGAKCPTSNVLDLQNFRYYAVNGAYNTAMDAENDFVPVDVVPRDVDAEGYVNIEYGIGFNNPYIFYDNAEILQAGFGLGPYYPANLLAPGAEMALTFKLSLPEPCNGDFDTGSLFFWGEAI